MIVPAGQYSTSSGAHYGEGNIRKRLPRELGVTQNFSRSDLVKTDYRLPTRVVKQHVRSKGPLTSAYYFHVLMTTDVCDISLEWNVLPL